MKKNKAKLIDWKADASGSKIIFFETPDGPELAVIDAERLGLLTNGDYMREQLRDAVQEKLYPADWGLKEFVEIGRLLQGGLNLAQIAALWDTTDALVRAFYGQAQQKFLHSRQEITNERARQEKSDGVSVELETPRLPDYKSSSEIQTHITLNISQVAAMLKANGNNYREVWQTFGVKSDAFSRWLDANRKALAILGAVL